MKTVEEMIAEDEMDGDPLSHGSTERRALELKNVPGCDALFFVGGSVRQKPRKWSSWGTIPSMSSRPVS